MMPNFLKKLRNTISFFPAQSNKSYCPCNAKKTQNTLPIRVS